MQIGYKLVNTDVLFQFSNKLFSMYYMCVLIFMNTF